MLSLKETCSSSRVISPVAAEVPVKQACYNQENKEILVSDCDSMWSKHVGMNFLRLARKHQNIGSLENPSGKGKAVGLCGDSVEVFLQIKGDSISDIKVSPRGCVYTWFCASVMSELVKGENLDDALYVEPDEIAAALGGLPEDRMHCARLAVYTLEEAIADYYKNISDRSHKSDVT